MNVLAGPRRGAVLVESLVAVALLAVVMGWLVRFAATGMDESALAHRRTGAALLAQEKVEEMMRARGDMAEWLRRAEERYPVDEGGRHRLFAADQWEAFRWDWEFSPFGEHPGLDKVTVRVFEHAPRGREDRLLFELSMMLFSPAAARGGGMHEPL